MAVANDVSSLRNHVSLPGQGRKESVLGTHHIFKLEAQHTGGAIGCIELTVPPGEGVPMHIHDREDELFYVVSGVVEIAGEGLEQPVRMERGSLFFGPRGRSHTFRNPGSENALLIVVLTPGDNMQAMFGDLAALTGRSTGMPAPAEVGALCAGYGITFVHNPAQ